MHQPGFLRPLRPCRCARADPERLPAKVPSQTGACPGLPHQTVLGAEETGGHVAVVIGGRSGTLGEFAIAYEEGKLIGIASRTIYRELKE